MEVPEEHSVGDWQGVEDGLGVEVPMCESVTGMDLVGVPKPGDAVTDLLPVVVMDGEGVSEGLRESVGERVPLKEGVTVEEMVRVMEAVGESLGEMEGLVLRVPTPPPPSLLILGEGVEDTDRVRVAAIEVVGVMVPVGVMVGKTVAVGQALVTGLLERTPVKVRVALAGALSVKASEGEEPRVVETATFEGVAKERETEGVTLTVVQWVPVALMLRVGVRVGEKVGEGLWEGHCVGLTVMVGLEEL